MSASARSRSRTSRRHGRFFPSPRCRTYTTSSTGTSEAVLDHCTRAGIGFVPWSPLARGALAREGSALAAIAGRHGVGDGPVALAWLLKRSPVMLPIPGTGDPKHLADNMRGAGLTLSQDEFEALDRQGREASAAAGAG